MPFGLMGGGWLQGLSAADVGVDNTMVGKEMVGSSVKVGCGVKVSVGMDVGMVVGIAA